MMIPKPTPTQKSDTPASLDRFEEIAFKWGGLILIFLAVAFAMSIAIDHGLFTPSLRVAAGIAVGLGLIGFGLFTYIGRPVFGQSLQGVGLAVLFLSLFAGHQLFDVVSYGTATVATVLVTLLSFWLAARRGDSALAAIGLVGGLAAPFVLSLGGDAGGGTGSVVDYAIYASILLLAAVALYYFNGWGSLLVTSGILAIATYAMIIDRLEPAMEGRTLVQATLIAVAAALWLVPVARILLDRPVQVSRHSLDHHWTEFFRGTELGSVIWVPGAALAGTAFIWSLSETRVGVLALGAAALVAAVGFVSRRAVPILGLTHFVSASTLLATASVLLLEGPSLQLALAGQAFASLVVGRRVGSPVLIGLGALLAGPVAGWVFSDLATAFSVGEAVGTGQLLVHLAIIGFLTAGALLDPSPQIRSGAGAAAYALLAIWFAEAFLDVTRGGTFTTAAWIGMGALAAYIGLANRSRGILQAALATVLIAVGKLLTVDIVYEDAVGRTLSFFVAGIVLVVFGYRYPAMRAVLGKKREDAKVSWRAAPPPEGPAAPADPYSPESS